MIKAVIFDMDGLLIDSEPLWREAEKEPFKNIGLNLTDAEIHQQLGRGIQAYVEHFYRVYPWEGPTVHDVIEQIVENLIALVKQKGELKPGALATLKLCKQAGLPMAVASSSPYTIIDAVVDSLHIRGYFDHIHSGVNEPYGKPHPGVFITAADFLHTPPYECLVFEDAPSGVLAAKAARMHCVAVPEPDVKDHPYIQTADKILNSLEQFDEALLKQF